MDPTRRAPPREPSGEPERSREFALQEHPDFKRLELLTGALNASLFRISATKLNILQQLDEQPRSALELADLLGVHRSAIHRHLNALVKGGLVQRSRTHRGAYELAPLGHRVVAGP